MKEKEKEIAEEVVEEKKVLEVIWDDDDLDFENPKITGSRGKNHMRFEVDGDNYIETKIFLSRAQKKRYDKEGLENFELDKKDKDIVFKDEANLDTLISIDKTAVLEHMLYKKIVVGGEVKKPSLEDLKESNDLMPLRNIAVKKLMELNEMGL